MESKRFGPFTAAFAHQNSAAVLCFGEYTVCNIGARVINCGTGSVREVNVLVSYQAALPLNTLLPAICIVTGSGWSG